MRYPVLAIVFLMFLSLSCFAADKSNTIAIKAGSYDLSKTNQVVLGSNINLTEGSDSVFAVEYMRSMSGNYRLGGELISFKNNYTQLASRGEIDTLYVLFTADKYWQATSWMKPYLGVGVGAVTIDVSGPIAGDAGGFAFAARAGLDFTLSSNIGLLVEYKYLSGKPDDSNNQDIDVSGSGIFAGLNIYF